MSMKVSIITPSFRQLDWLACCIASVADQGETGQKSVEFEVEHIVQDAGTAGIEGFAEATAQRLLAKYGGERRSELSTNEILHLRTSSGYELRFFRETDNGMYDAVNRGLHRSRGELLAYLNCDEQYLPGAIAQMVMEFQREPRAEVIFAGCLVTNEHGHLLAARPACPLSEAFVRTCHLPNFTASMFFRRNWFQSRQAWFNTQLRDVADAVWVLARLQEGSRVRTVKIFTTTFADTGLNMNLSPNARKEHRQLRATASRGMRILRPWWIFLHRAGKLMRGEYFPRHRQYRIFQKNQVETRVSFDFRWAGGVWWSRFFFREPGSAPSP
jgi:glycosyltransferase involved in cell wall biosynthesis